MHSGGIYFYWINVVLFCFCLTHCSQCWDRNHLQSLNHVVIYLVADGSMWHVRLLDLHSILSFRHIFERLRRLWPNILFCEPGAVEIFLHFTTYLKYLCSLYCEKEKWPVLWFVFNGNDFFFLCFPFVCISRILMHWLHFIWILKLPCCCTHNLCVREVCFSFCVSGLHLFSPYLIFSVVGK